MLLLLLIPLSIIFIFLIVLYYAFLFIVLFFKFLYMFANTDPLICNSFFKPLLTEMFNVIYVKCYLLQPTATQLPRLLLKGLDMVDKAGVWAQYGR